MNDVLEIIKEFGESIGSLTSALVAILALIVTWRLGRKYIPPLQEEKVMYVKFLNLTPKDSAPAYTRHVSRLNKDYEVWTESIHYRLNKFNKPWGIEIEDSSTNGIVDSLNVIHPWKTRPYTHESRDNNERSISRKLKGSDTYSTVSTYLNGFLEGNSNYSIMAEFNTKKARLIIDFSTIPQFDNLFLSPPVASRFTDYSRKHDGVLLHGLSEVQKGVFVLEASDLKYGEMIDLEFKIDWEYLKKHNKH